MITYDTHVIRTFVYKQLLAIRNGPSGRSVMLLLTGTRVARKHVQYDEVLKFYKGECVEEIARL